MRGGRHPSLIIASVDRLYRGTYTH